LEAELLDMGFMLILKLFKFSLKVRVMLINPKTLGRDTGVGARFALSFAFS